ncbi:hypothetical protein V8G69_01860 [Gaetbulibacter sp. M235]|uniref:hypothetical protein n=1 Tax=Gaetbulibacter sp. M235 TaxID=3126510 RepID=UPI00374F1542
MKKVINKSVIMVVMCTALLSNANVGSSFIPKKEKEIAKTIVTINDVSEGQSLIIKDLNGFILYKELIKQSGLYSKSFDLTELPNGDYVFQLEKDMEIKTIPFKVASNKVNFIKEKETTIYKPYVFKKNNYIYINKLALNGEPLDIKIYYDGNDSNESLIYSETIKDVKTIGKAYKLLKHATGNYRVVLTSNNRTYYERFNL